MHHAGGKKLHGKDGQLPLPACLDGASVEQSQYKGTSAVYRTAVAGAADGAANSKQKPSQQQTLPQHRVWYVFDSTCVLPEYLVKFRYTVKPGSTLATACMGLDPAHMVASQASCLALMDKISQLDPLLKLCAWPILPWLATAQDQQTHQQGSDSSSNGVQTGAAAQEEAHCRSLIAAVELACPSPQLPALAPLALTPITGGKEVSVVLRHT